MLHIFNCIHKNLNLYKYNKNVEREEDENNTGKNKQMISVLCAITTFIELKLSNKCNIYYNNLLFLSIKVNNTVANTSKSKNMRLSTTKQHRYLIILFNYL